VFYFVKFKDGTVLTSNYSTRLAVQKTHDSSLQLKIKNELQLYIIHYRK